MSNCTMVFKGNDEEARYNGLSSRLTVAGRSVPVNELVEAHPSAQFFCNPFIEHRSRLCFAACIRHR